MRQKSYHETLGACVNCRYSLRSLSGNLLCIHGNRTLMGIEPWLRQANVRPQDEKDMIVRENGGCYYFKEESEDE
jgi:hypothetical protein